MNKTENTPAPGFLAALFPLTRYNDSLEVTIGADNGRLFVSVSALNHKPLEASGTPAELERDLPAHVAAYARWVDAQEAARACGKMKITMPGATPAPAPRVREAAPKPPRKPATRKKHAVRKSPKRKPAPRRTPAMRKVVSTPAAGLAGKPECIADYKALKAKHGDKLTRRIFVDNAKTSRRYEKLWGNSWPKFVKEAGGGKPAITPAKADKKPKTAKPASLQSTLPAGKDTKKAPKKAEAKKQGPWTIKADGKTLGATILEKKPGDTYAHSGGMYTVQSVDAEKRVILVAPAGPKSAAAEPAAEPGVAKTWDELFPSKNPAPKKDGAAKGSAVPYAIVTEDGKKHGATIEVYKIGDKRGPRNDWEVIAVDHEKREYTLRSLDAAAAAKLLPANQQTASQTESAT